MSDVPGERPHNSNSKSKLIDVHHVGVTAKLQSPLKTFFIAESSTETENGEQLRGQRNNVRNKYNKFENSSQIDSETTEPSKILYEMRTACPQRRVKGTPAKIEFQLYKQPKRTQRAKKKTFKRKLYDIESQEKEETPKGPSIFKRLRQSLGNMRRSQTHAAPTGKTFGDVPEPMKGNNERTNNNLNGLHFTRETHIGIYPFEHGCGEYLRTTDTHPQILSLLLAERATYYATRFWAEVFGTLHIGVAFFVTLLLQTYRFCLYSLVNTLIAGLLHMTSDYLLKPLLTVLFNGFLQPPLVLIYNILLSIRDILEPIAETINNFMKPLATVFGSFRLIHVSYNSRKPFRDV